MLVKDLGLEHGNSVQTPATPDVMEEEESEPLSQVQHQQYRSQVSRCLFLIHDCQIERLARYLKRERQWKQVFEYGKMAEELALFTDSDWAGCKET